MRLTCPNCAAQYEVPDDVIPDEGRDVQCSNCGQTWFQAGANTQGAAIASPPLADQQAWVEDDEQRADLPSDEIQTERAATATDASADVDTVETDTGLDHEADVADTATTEEHADDVDEPGPEETETTAPAPRGLDPAISDILREEAEREANLRAAEANSLQSQPDLGLVSLPEEASARRAREAREQMARMRGEDPQQLANEDTESRRGLLPNIDEINSTLRSGETSTAAIAPPVDAPAPRKKRSFTRGFALAILVALALAMAYDNAPLIAQKVPQADPYLSSYVAKVDAARLWLDTQVRAFTVQQ